MGFHADAATIQTIAGRLEAEELTSEQVRAVSERCGTAEQHPVQTCGGGARVQAQRHPPRGAGGQEVTIGWVLVPHSLRARPEDFLWAGPAWGPHALSSP